MIGLFSGETDFPKLIIKKLKKKKIDYLIIDLTKRNIFKKDKNSYHISIGKFGTILKLFKSKKCKKAIFAGKIDKPQISKLKLDAKGLYYIPRIIKAARKGDAAILKELIKILQENNIKTISSNFFNPELTLKKGIYSKLKPSKEDLGYIKKGFKILQNTNSYDHIQAIIIGKNITVKENKYGTQKLIRSIKKDKKQNGILIKLPKKNQDLRVDLPTIGINTCKDSRSKNLKGIVVKANKNIIIDKIKCIKFVNKNKMFLVAK